MAAPDEARFVVVAVSHSFAANLVIPLASEMIFNVKIPSAHSA